MPFFNIISVFKTCTSTFWCTVCNKQRLQKCFLKCKHSRRNILADFSAELFLICTYIKSHAHIYIYSVSTFIANPDGIIFFGHSNSVVWKRQPDSISSTYFWSGLCITQTDISHKWRKNLTKPTVSTRKYHFTQNVFTQCFGKIVMSMQNCLKKQQKCFKNATTNLASLIR